MDVSNYLILAAVIVAMSWWHRRLKRQQQLQELLRYRFHPSIANKVRKRYPHLNEEQSQQVMEGLRDFFWCCAKAGNKPVAMPSQAVDVAWHEFILFTRAYERFCKQALGRFLHHTPTEVMSSPTDAQPAIKRAWRLACARESLNPKFPAHLPALFAMDARLSIEDGFFYSLNCQSNSGRGAAADSYCASHIGCSSGCAGVSGNSDSGGFFSSDSHSSDSNSGCSSCSGGGD